MKKLVTVILVMAVAMLQACGSASGPSGGNPGGGGNGGGDNPTSNLNFVFSGYAVGEEPILDCAGAGLDWSDITFDASGKATVGFEWADDVACNVHIGDKYIVGKDGLCSQYELKVNGVVITTGANNPQNTGKNWKFHVNNSGVVTLVGDTLETFTCGDNGGLPMDLEFTGYAAGLSPKAWCAGDGVTWKASQLDSNGQATIYGDPATYFCNMELSASNWAVQPQGVNAAYAFKVNGVLVATGVPNGQGGYNYSFILNSDGTITPNGSVLPTYGGTPGPGTVPLDFKFSGYSEDQDPALFCSGGGLTWVGHLFNTLGELTSNASAATLRCNIQFADGSWAVNSNGVYVGYKFEVNGVVINTGAANSSGGYDWTFTVNASGVVTTSGIVLPVYYGAGGSVPMNIVFSGYRASDNPKLYCSGNGLVWNGVQLDADGKAILYANQGVVACNLQLADGTWVVNNGQVWDGYSFKVNNFQVTTGNTNYQFQINSAAIVSGYGTSLTTYSLALYDVSFVYTGTYDISKMILHCAGGDLNWSDEYHFTLVAGVKSATITALAPSTNPYVCNVDMYGNNAIWLINNNGMLSGQTLKANGINLTKFLDNGQGSQNLVFYLNANGSITLP